MRALRRLAWAAVVLGASAAPGMAQQTGVGSVTGGTFGQTTGGALGSGTTGTTGRTTTGTGSTGTTQGTTTTGATPLATMEAAPAITAPTGQGTSSVDPSNIFGPYYANPQFQGLRANSAAPPGGFGTPLFGTGTGGTAGRTGTTGRTGITGIGGTTGRAGTGTGGVTTTDVGGVLVPLPRAMAYPAQVRFAAPAVPPVQIQADLRGVINRAPMLANPAAVQVQVDGNAVTLRGAVRDEEEARLVEGLVRLTPGVGVIRNELAYPRP